MAGPYVAPTTPLGSVLQYAPYQWNPDPHETNPSLKWPRSLTTYDAMITESQVISVLRAVRLPICGATWYIDPDGARDEVVEHVSKDLGLRIQGADEPPKRNRREGRFNWVQHLNWGVGLSHRYGHMYFEQEARIGDDGKAHLFNLWPRMPRRIVRLEAGNDGDLISISQNPSYDQNGIPNGVGLIDIPADRLVWYINDQEPGDWIGRSLLRAAYKNWLIKDDLLRVQAMTMRRQGMGVPVYTGATANEDLAPGWEIAQAIRAGEEAGAAIPNGSSLDLLGVRGTLPNIAEPIQYHDQQMARAVLAHFLNLGQQTGSWALGSAFQDFFVMSLQSMATEICSNAQTNIVEDIVDWNYGIDENAPQLRFKAIGTEQPLTATTLLALRQAGMIIPDRELEQYVRSEFELPTKTVPSPGANPAYPAGDTPPLPHKDVPSNELNTDTPV